MRRLLSRKKTKVTIDNKVCVSLFTNALCVEISTQYTLSNRSHTAMLTIRTILGDLQRVFGGEYCNDDWQVKNQRYALEGIQTIKQALEKSENFPNWV